MSLKLVCLAVSGLNRTLDQPSNAAARPPQTGRSCIAQHFRQLIDRSADKVAFSDIATDVVFQTRHRQMLIVSMQRENR